MNQLSIDFVHTRENNRESEMHLEANLDRFNGQCRLVLGLLMEGKELTTTEALVEYRIGDLRARIRDLRRSGFDILDEFVTTAAGERTRFKKYFINQKSKHESRTTKR